VCDICKNEFDSGNPMKVPKMLKCGHSSFCKACLLDMAKRHDNLLKCPICEKKQIWEDSEREIPTNFPLMQLIDELRKQREVTPGEDDDEDDFDDSDDVDPAVVHIRTEKQEINQVYENMNIKIDIVLKAIMKLKEQQREVNADKEAFQELLSQKPNPPQINQSSLLSQLDQLKRYSKRINTKILNKIAALKDKQKKVAESYVNLEKIFNFGEIKSVQLKEQEKITVTLNKIIEQKCATEDRLEN